MSARGVNNYILLIEKLDQFIRKFYLNKIIRGSLYCLGFLVALFLVFNLLESKYYFSQGARKLLFYGFLFSSGGALVWGVLLPLLKYFKLGSRISNEQAAFIIGDHFENVKDKLLNILQLKSQSNLVTDTELIEASIQQKSEEIKLVPFKTAIDLSKNRRYVKYAAVPLLILLALLFGQPSLIKDSTRRLIHNNQDFEKAVPFKFIIDNELKAIQYADFEMNLHTEGDLIPQDAFINLDNFVYKLEKTAKNSFRFQFNNLQKNTSFNFFSGEVESGTYTLEVLEKPVLVDFSVRLSFPGYLQRLDVTLNNTGDLVVPEGTKVFWTFKTNNTGKVRLNLFGQDITLDPKGENIFEHSQRITKSGNYRLYLDNLHSDLSDSLQYSLQLVPDQFPSIVVESFKDSTDQDLTYFIGNATDDYGLTKITFNHQIISADGVAGPLKQKPIAGASAKALQYSYTLLASEFQLKPGEQISYYFEAFDNDAPNGFKSSKSQVFNLRKLSEEEIAAKADANTEDIKKNLEASLKETKKLQEELEKLRNKLLQEKELNWQNKKEVEKLMERYKNLQELIEEAKKKFEENAENQQELNNNPEHQEDVEKLKELFEDLEKDETKEMMKQIEDLLNQLNKEDLLQMMQKFQFNNQENKMQMDRLLELLKNMEVEQKLQNQIDKLKDMAQEQEKLSEETANEQDQNAQKQDELEKKQDELEKKLDELNKEFNDLQKKNEDLKYPKEIEDQQKERDDVKKDMQQAKEQINQKQNKPASKKQKQAAQKMQQMAENMQQQMSSQEMEQMQEDMAALRQLLENLIDLSFNEERLIMDIAQNNVNTPHYVSLIQQQYKLKDNFQLIQDSLIELSKRVPQIETFITDKISEVNENMQLSVDRMEDRQKSQAAENQQRIMKNVNDLALMLNESMQQMQQQMSSMMSGSQMCNNPTQGPGQQLPDKIQNAGEQSQEQMERMKKGLQEGGQNLSSEEFAKMAAKQGALREALKEIQKEKQNQGKGSKELDDLINKVDEIETQLVNKRLTNEMLKRQQEIRTRLLEAENAERQRGEDEKRKAEQARDIERELPPSLQEYLKKREAEIDIFKFVSPDVKPYYKALIDTYLKSLKPSAGAN